VTSVKIYLFMMMLLTGCTVLRSRGEIEKSEAVESQSLLVGVNLKAEEGSLLTPKIVSQEVGNEFGPSLPDVQGQDAYRNAGARLYPIIALNFGPGLMRGYLHLHTLREFERHQVRPSIITGTEIGAVIGILYAFGLTPDVIEWRFINFLREAEGIKPGSREWVGKVKSVLLQDLAGRRIEEAALTLLIPTYSQSSRTISMNRHGNIGELIRLQYSFRPERRGGHEISAFPFDPLFAEQLRSNGADLIFFSNVLGESILFDTPDSYLFGLFGRASSRIRVDSERVDSIVDFHGELFPLDSTNNRSIRSYRADSTFRDQFLNIRQVVDQWDGRRIESGVDRSQFDHDLVLGEDE
jgi:hypothetical protein